MKYYLNWFDIKKVNAESSQFREETGVYLLPTDMKHKDIISYLKSEGKYLEMTVLQALQEAIKRLKNGFFDKKDTYLVIPLSTIGEDGSKYVLSVFRDADERLYMFIRRYNPKVVWPADHTFLVEKTQQKS